MPDLHKEAIEALSQHFLADNVDTIALHSIGIILNIVGATLLLRIASATENSRFLRHLAVFYAFMAVGRLSLVITMLVVDRVAIDVFLINPAGPTAEELKGALAAIARIETFGTFVDVILSFLTSFWMYLTWRILIRYPKEGIKKGDFTLAVAVFGPLLGFLAAVAVAWDVAMPMVIQWGDVIFSAVMLIIVGFELRRRIGKAKQLKSAILRDIVFAAYVGWAVLQPMYWTLKTAGWYKITLLLSSFVAMLLTVIYAASELEEKEAFQSQPRKE